MDENHLQKQIKDKNAVAVVGAGVSMATTEGNPIASWKGLIENGVERCSDWLKESKINRIEQELDEGDLIGAARKIRSTLEDNYCLYHWLSETVGKLEPKNSELIRAIRNLGIPVVTTNYDSLIEDVTTWDPAHWKKPALMKDVLSKPEETMVGHLHGHWRDAESVILGPIEYGELRGEKSFQSLLQSKALFDSFIYIGYGDGLRDPTFKGLYEWLRDTHPIEVSEWHFRLATAEEKERLDREGSDYGKMCVIDYGDTYEKLPSYLRGLAPETEDTAPVGVQRSRDSQLPARAPSASGRPVSSKRPRDSGASEAPYIISYRERLKRLKGDRWSKQAYLVPDHLEFVDPDPETSFHPEQILRRLRGLNQPPGVLLVGPGGVGKSRTLLETAKLAYIREGWQVLHTVATEISDNDKLREEIAACESGKSRTLLVVDRAERVGLNFNDILKRIRPELDQDLTILACARESYYKDLQEKNGLELFGGREGVVRVRPEEIPSRKIAARIRKEVAPLATRDLGPEVVADFCGDRPAIALFIADQLESRAEECHASGRSLDWRDIEGISRKSLTAWLEERFKEDRLAPQASDSAGRPEATERLLAAATVSASTPAERSVLIDTATDAFSETSESPREDGHHIVGDLEELGWLERRELEWEGSSEGARGLEVAHDVVTDKLLDEVLREGSDSLAEKRLEQLLAHCAENLVVWANMTQALDRNRRYAHKDMQATVDQKLLQKAESWLENNGSALAQTPMMTRRDDRYRSSHALSVTLETELWTDDLLVRKLALPWLQMHGSKCRLARFLLVKVLKTGCEQEAVIDKALDWFENYTHLSEAPYVLYAVSMRLNGGCEQSSRAATVGIRWLEYHAETSNESIWNGQFIITSILQWEEKRRTDDLVMWALRWLDEFGQHRRALYVILTVFKQAPPEGEQLAKVRRHALDWFEPETREMSLDAHTVINALLENLMQNKDLEAFASKKEVAGYASSWLSANAHTIEARYVLQPALHWIAEAGNSTSLFGEIDPVEKAVQWLENEEYLHAEGSEFVVGPLLRTTSADDDEDTFKAALKHALRWLKQHKDEERAQQVLSRVLRHPDVEHDTKVETAESALTWLKDHSSSPKRDFVINSLLMNWEAVSSSGNRQTVVEASLELSRGVIQNKQEAAFDREEAKKVLLYVLSLPKTSRKEEAESLIEELGYDVHIVRFRKRSAKIESILDHTNSGNAERANFIEEGANWLCDSETYRKCEKWTYFLERIFKCDDLKSKDRNRVADAVSKWVCDPSADRDADWFFAYEAVLETRSDFPQGSSLVKVGFDWISSRDDLYYENFHHKSWRHMYKSMLEHPALDWRWREKFVRVGKDWLDGDGEEQDDHWHEIYTVMLEHGELNDTNVKELIVEGTNWLTQNRTHEKWQKVYDSAEKKARQLDTGRDKHLRMLSNAARIHQSL